METIKFMAVKGGQGVTVTAAAFAVRQAQLGRRVHLLATSDTLDVLGVAAPKYGEVVQVMENLTVGWAVGDAVDCDVLVMDSDRYGPADRTVLVTRPCFLALRRAVASQMLGEVTDVVLISEQGRSIDERDVAETLGKPVVTTALEPSVARAVDAGLLAVRLPHGLARLAERILPRPERVGA